MRSHALLVGIAAGIVLVTAIWALSGGSVQPAQARAHGTPEEARFGEAAATVAGFPVQVRCWSLEGWQQLLRELGQPGDAVGVARSDGHPRVDLAPSVCAALHDLLADGVPLAPSQRADLADALTTLGHETRHVMLLGGGTEAEAECFGMQSVPALAVSLGVRPDDAVALASLQWQATYPRLDARYRSPECRDGGQLDLAPSSHRWP
jgi:hypothetical protein